MVFFAVFLSFSDAVLLCCSVLLLLRVIFLNFVNFNLTFLLCLFLLILELLLELLFVLLLQSLVL